MMVKRSRAALFGLRAHREWEKRFCHSASFLVRREPITPFSLAYLISRIIAKYKLSQVLSEFDSPKVKG
jgi:hypothetical protein